MAPGYDRFNQAASLGLDRIWRCSLVQELAKTCPPGGAVLDVGCGTGDLIFDLLNQRKDMGLKCIGLDLSLPMMALARKKTGNSPLYLQASCGALPLADHSVEAVMSAFVLRNARKIMAETLSEIKRVLKPGGTAFLLEMSVPEIWALKPFHTLYLKTILPAIGRAVFGVAWSQDYLAETIFQFWSPREFSGLLTQAGFREARFKHLTLGLSVLHISKS